MAKIKAIVANEMPHDSSFVKSVWFTDLVSEIKEVLQNYSVESGELSFSLKWSKIQAMHDVGRLVSGKVNDKISMASLILETSKAVGISERDVYYCISFVKAYPELKDTPEGKSITWNRLKKQYLTEGKSVDASECNHRNFREDIVRVCLKCGKRTVVKNQ